MRNFIIIVVLGWCFLFTGCEKPWWTLVTDHLWPDYWPYEECFKADNKQDTIYVKDNFIAPCAFTPNGDGINDVFEVRTENGDDVLLKIYTRAGALVFESERVLRCRWDGYSLSGQEMSEGIYYYTAVIYLSIPKHDVKISGFVHLYRNNN